MKRILTAVCVVFFSCIVASAAPVGWIRPEAKRWYFGGEGGYLSSQHFEGLPSTQVYKAEGMYGVGRISYGWNDRLEFYVRGGIADADLRGIRNPAFANLNTSTEAAWGGGVQGILYEDKMWNLALDLQYFSHGDHTGVNSAGVPMSFMWSESQGSLLVQSKFEKVTPYLGVSISQTDLDFDLPAGTGNLVSQDDYGAILGVGVTFSEDINGYLETRLANETAVGGGVRFSF